ncbi:ribonuclease E inhibitor RraB [Chitinophaga sp. Mgbs1]|uniref:Ribonuclease E inhibitor RraB n=1 Tax=Chitinophaga solisilvae TaxID=1233460 RepID=A0A433W8J9_9BACT|nr:ribonuclease E inhibitor RraB [Chitinophaga solisilvae]NSL91250.1 ribonuclease E inhibitor RraB [Chitinophaga solisilvae]
MQSKLESIKGAFDKMKGDGFNTNSNLRWGFFFFNDGQTGLKKVYDELKEHSYVLESLEKVDFDEWRLHVSKMDTLSPEKLHKRNIAFNKLADFCKGKLYDGWDVEKISV